jgi:hypothetical protein
MASIEVYALVAVVAVGVLILAEVLVAYQKYRMKKQFLENLSSASPNDENKNTDRGER